MQEVANIVLVVQVPDVNRSKLKLLPLLIEEVEFKRTKKRLTNCIKKCKENLPFYLF